MSAQQARAWPGLEDDPNPFVPAPAGPKGEAGAAGTPDTSAGAFRMAVNAISTSGTLPAESQLALVSGASTAVHLPLAADCPGALIWVYPLSGDSYTLRNSGDDSIVQLGAGEVGPTWNLTGNMALFVSDGVATWRAKAL